MTSVYGAGPRLSEPIQGDRHRQAVLALGGYAYQLAATAHAWLDLREDEVLYVEIAEDYATALAEAMTATQVKASATPITLLSPVVAQAIDSLIDLAARNPGRNVLVRLLTTASVGEERSISDRPGGMPGLLYWRSAAAGAPVEPLRQAALANTHLSDCAKAFVAARDDVALRADLLRRIHWDTDQPDGRLLRTELEERVVDRGLRVHRLSREVCLRLTDLIMGRLLAVASDKDSSRRALTRDDLDHLIDANTHVPVRQRDLDKMVAALTGSSSGQLHISSDPTPSFLRREAEAPLPRGLAQRQKVVSNLATRAQSFGAVILVGGTGLGKTTLARFAARTLPGDWLICQLTQSDTSTVNERVNRLLVYLGTAPVRGVILDDLDGFDSPVTQEAVSRLLAALRRRDQLCFITGYRAPAPRILTSTFGLSTDSVVTIGNLDFEETSEVVAASGGDSETWSQAIYNGASRGHPQLTHAIVAGLAVRNWPGSDKALLLRAAPSTSDIDAERASIRRRLLEAVPDDSRALLYRTTVVCGPFSRPLAIALGEMQPSIARPGEALDRLVGPWIDAIGRRWFRASPLVHNAGAEVLGPTELQMLHRTIAEKTFDSHELDPILVNVAFSHALIARSHMALVMTAQSIIFASEEDLAIISPWIDSLRDQPINQLILPENVLLSYMLRLAQVLLLGPSSSDEKVAAAGEALFAEIAQEPDPTQRDRFFYISTTKLLFKQALSGRIPHWFERLLELREVIQRNPSIAAVKDSVENSHQDQPGLLDGLFAIQTMGLRNIKELSALFDSMDNLPADIRNEFLSDKLGQRYGFAFIDITWAREHRRGGLDGVDGERKFLRMAKQAESWGRRELALRCHLARAVMLDEYQERPDDALAALGEAAEKFSDDPLLIRARARVFYRRKEHGAALDLLSQVADTLALEHPVERVFMLREAGISAAELGEWGSACKWYSAAHDAASSSPVSSMRPMAIGLLADLAVAEFNDKGAPATIRTLARALTSLSDLDAESSLQAYYCHCLVRHAILWCHDQVTTEPMNVDGEPTQMLPGWGSNPEPSDAIRAKVITPLEIGWYLLARVDLLSGCHAGVASNLSSQVAGREIAQLELVFAQDQMEAAITLSEPERFGAWLKPLLDAAIFLKNNEAVRRSAMEHPLRSVIPSASKEDLTAPASIEMIENAILAFALSAAFEERIDRLEALRVRLSSEAVMGSFEGPVRQMLDAFAKNHSNGASTAIAKMMESASVAPNQLFVATLRFLEYVVRSPYRKLLAPKLARWTRKIWRNVVKEQRFSLRSPNLTIPDLEASIEGAGDNVGSVARIVLAAEATVREQLSPQFRAWLDQLEREQLKQPQ